MNPGPCCLSDVNDNTLSISHCNIKSLRNKIDYIVDISCEFNNCVFTETHLDDNILDNYII